MKAQKIHRAFLKANGLSSSSPGLPQPWVCDEVHGQPQRGCDPSAHTTTMDATPLGLAARSFRTQGCGNPGLEVKTPLGLSAERFIGTVIGDDFLRSHF